jgi:mannose-6-phosphate isomerase-like protein (cupin superfamily)
MTSKILHTPSGAGNAVWFFGDKFTFLATGAETGGSYSTLEALVSPGNGPIPHIHHNADEQFYVLEGKVHFSVGDQTFSAGVGDFVHIPQGTVHSFKNHEKQAARLLATFPRQAWKSTLHDWANQSLRVLYHHPLHRNGLLVQGRSRPNTDKKHYHLASG